MTAPAGMTAYPDVTRWADMIATQAAIVQHQQGVLVPVPVAESIMQIESQGNPQVSTAGAYGLMQVTAGSVGSYDLDRAQADPAYGIWAGLTDLAMREEQSGLPWENVAVGYFSGHYQPTGAQDSEGTTDYEYENRFKSYLADFSNQPGGVAGVTAANAGAPGAIDVQAMHKALSQFGPHAALFGLGLTALVGGVLWLHH